MLGFRDGVWFLYKLAGAVPMGLTKDMLTIGQDAQLARLVDVALERVWQGLDSYRGLSGYLRGLAAAEPEPEIRAALVRFANHFRT